jgi:hypothetical protein
MARIALARTFLQDFVKLERPMQRKVQELLSRFQAEHRSSGLNLEAYNSSADPRSRTARVDAGWRAVLAAPEHGDIYILVKVLPHDQADRWMVRNRFTVNTLTGALEVWSISAFEELPAVTGAGTDAEATPSVLGDRSDKDFRQLGIVDEAVIAVARRAQTDDELRVIASALPADQADALLGLAMGMSVEEIYAELLARISVPAPDFAAVDPDDLVTAATREVSRSAFLVVEDEDELAKVLSGEFEEWQVFLHPTQRAIATRDYSGPARITGGAGTGKTVALLHRAVALARAGNGSARVLVTTFTRSLADDLRVRLRTLGGPELLEQIDVRSIDALAHRIVTEADGGQIAVLFGHDLDKAWEDAIDLEGIDREVRFMRQEWEQVVLGQGLRSRDDYFAASRAGRGVRLARRDRAAVWAVIEAFETELSKRGRRTFLQLSDAAAGYLAASTVKPYDHVLVDEAQDLHPAQWRMLRELVEPGRNDLFIAGDTHQRIYEHRVTLSSLGIETRGRSARLRLNYRTTHEILRWSLELLAGEAFDDLEGGEDTLAGYRSVTHGDPPVLVAAAGWPQELADFVDAVRGWVADGLAPEEIGVSARTTHSADQAREALRRAGLPSTKPGNDDRGICVGSMHGMKGLEFRVVAMVDVSASSVPPTIAVTSATEDEVAHRQDLQRERCLLYVAATRAREQLRVSWSGGPSKLLVSELR